MFDNETLTQVAVNRFSTILSWEKIFIVTVSEDYKSEILKENPKLHKDNIIVEPARRETGPAHVDAIVRGKNAQVLLLSHDLLGALARKQGAWALPVEPGGERQRQYAIRLAVNLAMYVLCSDYKDDQVHAPWLMRRRARRRR